MWVGAVADVGVHKFDVGVRDVGVQVVAGDHRHVVADDAAHQGEQRAFGIVVVRREPCAMQHAIDAVERPGVAQAVLPFRHHAIEERLLHRAVRLGHRQQERHRFPGAGGIHVGDEAGQFAQHVGSGRARVRHHRVAAQQGARGEVLLRRGGGEAVALDGEAQQCDARIQVHFSPSPCGRGLGGGDADAMPLSPPPTPSRKGRGSVYVSAALRQVAVTAHRTSVTPHSVTPNSSAIRGVAFRPLPVSTSTVVCSGAIVPAASSLPNAAAACAAVGST